MVGIAMFGTMPLCAMWGAVNSLWAGEQHVAGEQTKGRDRDGRKACRLPAQNIAMKRVANHRIAARGHASKHCDKRLGASFAEQVLRKAGAVLQVCIVDQM